MKKFIAAALFVATQWQPANDPRLNPAGVSERPHNDKLSRRRAHALTEINAAWRMRCSSPNNFRRLHVA